MASNVQLEAFARPTDPPIRGWLHSPNACQRRCSGSHPWRRSECPSAAVDRVGGNLLCRWHRGPPLRLTFPANEAVRPAWTGRRHPRPSRTEARGHSDERNRSRPDLSRWPLLRRTPSQHALRRTVERSARPGRQRLLLLSYPLHPPRKPEQQRTQHLPDLHTPALFVQRHARSLRLIDELEQALKMIPAKTKLLPIEGAGHDLGFKGKAKHEDLTKTVLAAFQNFVS